MRFFVLKKGDDQRFWNIDYNKNIVTKEWGKIGQKGTNKQEEYLSEEFAKKDIISLIKKKLKEGYVEIDSDKIDPEKWSFTEINKTKTTSSSPKKSKEKRIPIELCAEKSSFEPQLDFETKGTFDNLKIIANYTCEKNEVSGIGEVNIGLPVFKEGYFAAVSESWSEVTDLFDLRKGTVCRITPPEVDRRVAAVLMDNNYLYAVASKGFEAEKRNLVKYDLATNEIVWSCASSASSITPRFVQDEDYIYSSDVKMLYIISKSEGRTVSKIEVTPKMNTKEKFYANTSGRFVKVIKTRPNNLVICGNLVNITLSDPIQNKVLWEIRAKKNYENIRSYYLLENKLYIIDGNAKLLVIDVINGSIEKTIQINIDSQIRRCLPFHLEGNNLVTIARYEKDRTLIKINLSDLTYEAKSINSFYSEPALFDPDEVFVGNSMISACKNQLSVIDLITGEVKSKLNLEGDHIIDFVVIGNHIYLAQDIKITKSDHTPNSSIIHQIR